MYREILSEEELTVLSTSTKHDSGVSCSPADSLESSSTIEHKALAELHDGFATRLAEAFGKIANREVHCRLRKTVRATFGQFIFAQTIPTCCAVVRAEPIQLEFYLAIQPTVLYPMMDRMLGARSVEPSPQRPMTEIERTVAMLIINELLTRYSRALQHALSLEFSVDRLEHNAQQLDGLPGGEPTYLAAYDLLQFRLWSPVDLPTMASDSEDS